VIKTLPLQPNYVWRRSFVLSHCTWGWGGTPEWQIKGEVYG